MRPCRDISNQTETLPRLFDAHAVAFRLLHLVRLLRSGLSSKSRNSPDQSASARHRPFTSGWPARSCASHSAISRRQRAIQESTWPRAAAIFSKSARRPPAWPSGRTTVASASQLHHSTGGSSSISRAWRLARSHAISVVPLPPKGESRIVSRPLLLFLMARSTNSTGSSWGAGR